MRRLFLGLKYCIMRMCFYGIKYEMTFRKTYKRLKRSASQSREEHDKKQFEELRALVRYAWECCPYYRQLFDEKEINVQHFTWGEYAKIPYLTKDIVIKEGKKLLSDEFREGQLEEHATGGSTGIPTKFYFEKSLSDAVEQAFVQNAYDMVGYKKWHRSVFFYGNMNFVTDQMAAKNCYWRRNHICNGLTFSSSHINRETIDFYTKRLQQFNPEWFVARPSAIYFLFKSLGNKIKTICPSLKGLIFMSEGLYDYQIKYFRNIYSGLKMMHVYGHTEHGCFAATYDETMRYQIYSEYGYSEFINSEGEAKEMVTTGFTNHVMPLIKYRTGDLFEGIDEVCEETKDLPYHTFKNVIGRTQDVLVCSDNSYYTAVTLDFSDIDMSFFDMVLKYQFIQQEKGSCEMLLVLNHQEDFDRVCKMIDLYFNSKEHRLDINFKLVNDINKSASGKERLIINESISLNDL